MFQGPALEGHRGVSEERVRGVYQAECAAWARAESHDPTAEAGAPQVRLSPSSEFHVVKSVGNAAGGRLGGWWPR